MKMIWKFVTVTFLAAACCASLNFSIARADDDGEQGGEIEGTEQLDVDLMMTPTASAPAGSSIDLSLKVEDEDGTTDAELKLEARGLPAGTYSVSVTLKSDGSTVALGTFSPDAQGEAEVEFVTNPEDPEEMPFPANFNPMDIATVSVSDSNSVVLFTADLTKVATTSTSSMTLTASITGQAGATDPNASGTALLNATGSKSGPKGFVQLSGSGFPAGKALTTFVNNSAISKKATTSSTGTFNFNFGPKGKASTVAPGVTLLQITSVTLKDSAGNVLMTFTF